MDLPGAVPEGRKEVARSLPLSTEAPDIPITDDAVTPESDAFLGTPLAMVEDFFQVQFKSMLGLEEVDGKLRITSQVSSVKPKEGGRVEVKTLGAHRLYRFDQAHFENVTGNIGELLNGQSHRVVATPAPDVFEIGVDASRFGEGIGGRLWAATNMYKACPEVVIPQTITEERLVLVADDSVRELLANSMDPSGADLTLARPVHLPDAKGRSRELRAGLTVHGRLSSQGVVRRGYWSRGDARASLWRTTGALGRCQEDAEPAPSDVCELEDRNWSLDNIKVGDLIVLRRGVAYAELFGPGSVDDFVSHWWGEESGDFLATLQRHERDAIKRQGGIHGQRRKYICTFSNRQHRVELGSWDDWKSFVFNAVLLHVKQKGGEVLVTLGHDAMCLERIWCIFEAWVCSSQEIAYCLYSVRGELRACLDAGEEEALKLKEKLLKLDLRAAQCSVQMDRIMIMRLVEDSDGGIEHVEYIVKRSVLTTQEIATSLQRVNDPLTGQRLQITSVHHDSTDLLPIRITPWKPGLRRSMSSSAAMFSAGDLHRQLTDKPGAAGIWSRPVLVTGPPGSGKSTLTTELAHLGGAKTAVKIKLTSLAKPIVSRLNDENIEEWISNADLLQIWAEAHFGDDGDDELLGYAGSGSLKGVQEGDRNIAMLLDDFHEVSEEVAVVLLQWMHKWVCARKAAGKSDRILITSRPDAIKIPAVGQKLKLMGFARYDLQPLNEDEAEKITRRVSRARGCAEEDNGALDRFMQLPHQLRRWPLMSTFSAHYCSRASAGGVAATGVAFSELGASASSTKGQQRLVRSAVEAYVLKASVLQFVKEEMIKQAVMAAAVPQGNEEKLEAVLQRLSFQATMQREPLGPYFLLAKAFNAAGRCLGAATVFGDERWERASTRVLSKAAVLAACQEAGLEESIATALFTAAHRNEVTILERAEQEDSIQFSQLSMQDYFAAAYLYVSPGDDPVMKSIWDSLPSFAISSHDMLGDLRDHLCTMWIAELPRPEGAHPPIYRLQVSARESHVDAVAMLLAAGLGRADSPDDVLLAAITSILFATRSDLVPVINVLSRHMNFVDAVRMFGFTFAGLIVMVSHCVWLVIATVMMVTSGSEWAPAAVLPALACCISAVTLFDRLNPFKCLLGFWSLAVWSGQRCVNFLVLPLGFILGLVFAGIVVFLVAIMFPVLLAVHFYMLPVLSPTLSQAGRCAKPVAMMLMILGNAAAIAGLVLQSTER